VAEADAALLVAHHHERGERKPAAALHHFRHAVDRDQLVDQAIIGLTVAIAIAPRR